MHDDATAEDTHVGMASLWVVIAVQEHSFCFELDGQTRHSIAIGSSPCADVRIEHAHAVPIECNLERDEDDVWLIPGWPTNVIRVDAVAIDRPVKLWRRCSLEIEGIAFDIRVREEPPTFPDCGLPDALGPFSESETISVGKSGPVVRDDSGQCWGDAYDGVPSSTAPFASSVTSPASDSRGPLERLGILTIRRPLSVTLGATLGAVVIAASMHLGLEMLSAMFPETAWSRPAMAAPLQHISRLCVRPYSNDDSKSAPEDLSICDPTSFLPPRGLPRTSLAGKSDSPERSH